MCDIIAIAFQTDKTRVASLLLARDLSALYYPFLDVAPTGTTRRPTTTLGRLRAHRALPREPVRVSGHEAGQMPEGDGTVLDNSCLMFLSNLWIGRKHDNTRLPVVLAGGLGGTLETGRSLDYLDAGDENRKMCSLYLGIMDRMGVKLDASATPPRGWRICNTHRARGMASPSRAERVGATKCCPRLIIFERGVRDAYSPGPLPRPQADNSRLGRICLTAV